MPFSLADFHFWPLLTRLALSMARKEAPYTREELLKKF
jgi:hypothetical protein